MQPFAMLKGMVLGFGLLFGTFMAGVISVQMERERNGSQPTQQTIAVSPNR